MQISQKFLLHSHNNTEISVCQGFFEKINGKFWEGFVCPVTIWKLRSAYADWSKRGARRSNVRWKNAASIGIFLYDLEHSDSSPSVDKITRIAGYFDVSSAWLLAGEEDGAEAFLRLYRQLSEPDREKLRAYMCALLGEER